MKGVVLIMNKKMKSLALLLVGIMSLGTLTACSGGNSSTPTPAGDNQTTASSTDNKKTDAPVNLVWWTIGNEPKDLKMVNDKINEYTKEKLNVTLEIKYASWGEYGDKVSKVVQSGENYDIAFGASINNYTDLAAKGYFADLTDLVPTAAPALWDFIPSDLWKGVTMNDKIFGVPTYKDSSQSQYWVWDKELVEKLGIDYQNIKTLEELEPALQAIKADNPSEYPLVLQGIEGINRIHGNNQ